MPDTYEGFQSFSIGDDLLSEFMFVSLRNYCPAKGDGFTFLQYVGVRIVEACTINHLIGQLSPDVAVLTALFWL
uniref:Uncharacterized protein n=1 Tax=Anguilla anguilla TaxID=7936 RepID=A0A0E9WR49_ANGAN